MEIRKMIIDDYLAVYELWMSCKGLGLNNIDDSREGIQIFLKRNPETCFVATERERIIGVIMAGHDGRRGYIYHTAVLPTNRKKGVGRKLVDTVTKALSGLGIIKVALVVFDRNETGKAFWEQQGFTVRNDLIYMNKSLTEIERIDT